MTPAHPLVFLRHGETNWNAKGLYQGTTDTDLAPTGIDQAMANAAIIKELLDDNVLEETAYNILASPLRRAEQTASRLSSILPNAPQPVINPDFRELSIGRWEGLTSMEVKEKFYEERKQRKTDRWNFKPAGGESMAQRSPIIAEALSALPPHSIVVTHSVVIRVLLHLLGGIEREEAAQAVIPHIGIYVWNGALLHRQDTIAVKDA